MHIGVGFDDDQGSFELAHVLRVNPEVRLQRDIDFHARWYVHETSTTPNGAVEGCEFVVSVGNDGAEVLAHQVFMFP